MNDGGGSGASCVGIKVRTDTTKLSDMVIASFGDGRNLIREGKMFIRDESKVASRVSGVNIAISSTELVSWLEFNVPFQHKYGYIRDDPAQFCSPGVMIT